MLLKENVNDFDLYFTNKETVLAVANYYVAEFKKSHPKSEAEVYDGANKDHIASFGGGGTGLNMTPERVKIIIQSSGIEGEQPTESDEESNFNAQQSTLQGVTAADDFVIDGIDYTPPGTTPVKPKYRPVFLSANAISLSDQVQLIIRFYGNADEIHENFDYVHAMNYWSSKEKEVFLKQDALEAILSKELLYIGSKYPLCSIIRTRKFLKRGWTINAGQYLKMCFQVSELDLTNVAVLEDQLTGVDVAYFNMLINAVKTHEENEKKEGKPYKLEYGYLATIIDKMF